MAKLYRHYKGNLYEYIGECQRLWSKNDFSRITRLEPSIADIGKRSSASWTKDRFKLRSSAIRSLPLSSLTFCSAKYGNRAYDDAMLLNVSVWES